MSGWTYAAHCAYVRHISQIDLLTTRDVADAYGVSTREIARRVETGALEPAVKLPGLRGAYLFDRGVLPEPAEAEQ